MPVLTEADNLSSVRTPEALRVGLDGRPDKRAEEFHGRPHRGCRCQGETPTTEACRLSAAISPRLPIAVVEAKTIYAHAGDGLQQAKEYAQILGLKFAYATNGRGIVEHDFLTGREADLDAFPSPDDLWGRLRAGEGIDEKTADRVLAPYYHLSGKSPRYYQEIAINRAVQAILKGKRRVLLTLATGTGKTVIASQICYKLWSSKWNRSGEPRRPRILYLADRNVLVDDPKDKTFTPFGDARWKISGEAVKSREMYFATYQAIARDEARNRLT